MEIPLEEDGVCDLGNINLTKLIIKPFDKSIPWEDNFNWEKYRDIIKIAVRFLDNVLDVSDYPFEELRNKAQSTRKIGLNAVSGLGSFLAMLCISYDSEEARNIAKRLQKYATVEAYKESVKLAKEKGTFKLYDFEKYLKSNFIINLVNDENYLHNELINNGIRNSSLMTIPPAGTGSMLAGNISSGIEPIFAFEYERKILQPDGSKKIEVMEDYAWRLYKEQRRIMAMGSHETFSIPDYFKTSMKISPKDHILMQAALQEFICNSISKTANIPESYTLEEYEELLMFAIENKVKGFTTFRQGTREGVLSVKSDKKEEVKVSSEIDKPKRPRVLDGKTYQIKEENNHRTYCTINYIEENGIKKPWEIFLFSSSRNHEFYSAIGRLASRIMRKTGDYQSVIDELKEIGGDNGYLTQEYGYIQSKSQHFGFILEEFVNSLNNGTAKEIQALECPECKEKTYIREGGCTKCTSCGFSKCN